MQPSLSFRIVGSLIALGIWLLQESHLMAADRVIIGNVSRTMEQLPNYAASDKSFFTQEAIQGDVVLIGSTDTLIQALIAGQWVHSHKEGSAELVTKRTGIPIKYTKPTVEKYLSQGIISRDGSVNREGFQRLIDLMGERLFKQKPHPAPEKYLDLSYLRRAQQELGIPSTDK